MCEFDSYDKTPFEFLKAGYKIDAICLQMNITKRKLFSKFRADLIRYVKELTTAGRTIAEIAYQTGMGTDSVKKLQKDKASRVLITKEIREKIIQLSKLGKNTLTIAKELSIPLPNVYEGLKSEIIKTYLKLGKIIEMKKKFGIRDQKIVKMIKSAGVIVSVKGKARKIHNHFGDGRYPHYIPINKIIKDIIEGELLGDGYIQRIVSSKKDYHDHRETTTIKEYKEALDTLLELINSKNLDNLDEAIEKYNKSVKAILNVRIASFGLDKSTKEEKYVERIAEEFERNGIPTHLSKHTNKKFPNIVMNAKSSIQMEKIYNEWYKNGIKTVPDKLKLNPNKVRHWYCGDGSYYRAGHQISIATHGFSENDTRKLAKKIDDEIGIHSYVYETYMKKQDDSYGHYWFIQFTKKEDVRKFFDYIDKSDKEILKVAKKEMSQKFEFDPHYLDDKRIYKSNIEKSVTDNENKFRNHQRKSTPD